MAEKTIKSILIVCNLHNAYWFVCMPILTMSWNGDTTIRRVSFPLWNFLFASHVSFDLIIRICKQYCKLEQQHIFPVLRNESRKTRKQKHSKSISQILIITVYSFPMLMQPIVRIISHTFPNKSKEYNHTSINFNEEGSINKNPFALWYTLQW